METATCFGFGPFPVVRGIDQGEERYQARAHAASLRVVTPISAACRRELEDAAAVFADAVAELDRRHFAQLHAATVSDCPGCGEAVTACTCLHRICY